MAVELGARGSRVGAVDRVGRDLDHDRRQHENAAQDEGGDSGLRPVKGLRRRTDSYFGRLGQEIDHRFSGAGGVPPFTRAHEELRATMRAFVLERLRPDADAWEDAGWFPNEVFSELAAS